MTTMFFKVEDGKPAKLSESGLCKLDWRIHTECKETIWSWVTLQWPPPRLSDVVAEYDCTFADCLNSGCGAVVNGARLSANQKGISFDSDPWIFATERQEKYIKEQNDGYE